MWNENFQMYKQDLEKAKEPGIKLPHLMDHRKSKVIPEKNIYTALLTILKPLTVWITTKCGKFLESWGYQTAFHVSWETCMQVKKQQLEPSMEQWTGLKLGKEYVKSVYGHPVSLMSM